MALTKIGTDGFKDDAVTTDKLANAINTERTANTAKSTNATHTGDVTGSGALTIAADAVTGAKIADDAVGAEHIEQLDADLSFADSSKAKFGTGDDLQIYHDASNSRSRIQNTTDTSLQILNSGNAGMLIQNQNSYNLEIKTNAEDAIKCVANGAVELYHNNVKKLETTSTGATVTGSIIADNTPGRRLNINGAMEVSQRGNKTGVNGTGYYACDRYNFYVTAGTYTVSQDTDAPVGFSKSLKLDCTTAESLGASDFIAITYRMEGFDCTPFLAGTSSAKKITLSFWVKSNLTGQFQVNFENENNGHPGGNDGINSRAVSISSANTWEKKVVTMDGDTSVGLNTNTNAKQFCFDLFLSAGTDFTSGGTLKQTWQALAHADRGVACTGFNLASSTDNYINITGVQLEIGDTATEFEYRSISDEVSRCQRYYEKSYDLFTAPGTAEDYGSVMFLSNRSPGTAHTMLRYQTRKRAGPSVTAYDPTQANTTGMRNLDDSSTYANYTFNRNGEMGCTAYPTGSISLGKFIQFHYTAECEI